MRELNAFSDYDKWSEIYKQGIFEAWVPFVSDRPLGFYVPKHGVENEGILTDTIADNTRETSRKVVTEIKKRKVVILTSDELCQNVFYPDVLIAKIVSVKDRHRSEEFYQMMIADEHPLYVHLPECITGVESYINLGQPMTIGKKLLIHNHKKMLPADRMELVEDRHSKLVDWGVIKSEGVQAVND